MKCLSEEMLRVYHDEQMASGALTGGERAEMERHIANCAECRARLAEISVRAARVQGRLHSLQADASGAEVVAVDARAALARYQALHVEEGHAPMLAQESGHPRKDHPTEMLPAAKARWFAPRWRLAWAAGAVAASVLVSLAFPSGRSLAQRLLSTLRVERVQPIRLDTSSFDENRTLQQMLSQLIADKVVVIKDEKPQKAATLEAASAAAGFSVRVPSEMAVVPNFTVMGQHALKMTMDRTRMQEILDESGRPDLLLPATIDGDTISVQMRRGVHVEYGDCPQGAPHVAQGGEAGNSDTSQAGGGPQTFTCTLLMEAPSPEVKVPENLNLQQLAEIGLQVAGMSAVQAREFCQTVDWKSTLVLPIPPFVRSYQTVAVDGVQGTLMTSLNRRGPQSVLIWVKDGIIYWFASPEGASETIALANSLN